MVRVITIVNFSFCSQFSLVFWVIFGLITNLPVSSQIFYQQNFDQLENGDLDGQDGWSKTWSDGMADFPEDISHAGSCKVQEEIKFGQGGKSICITDQTMTLRRFVGDYDGIQYLTLRFLYQSGNAPLSLYAGGSLVKWWAAASINVLPTGQVSVYNGDITENVGWLQPQIWHQIHLILDFDQRTFSCYLNDRLVAQNFRFRGENTRLVRNVSNPRLAWFHFGRHKKDEKLTAYLDELEIGSGPGGVYIAESQIERKLRKVLQKSSFDLISKRDLEQIETLDLSVLGLTDLTGLENCLGLKTLSLNGNQLSDISQLSVMTNLKELDLSNNQLASLTPCQNMNQLEQISVSQNQVQDILPLANLTRLRGIDLSRNQVNDISPLEKLVSLESLNLSQNQVQDLIWLKNLSKLKQLKINQNQIKDLATLTALAELEALEASENQINEVESLESLVSLGQLNLSDNKIKALDGLSSLRKLTNLFLDHNQIQDILPLRRLSNLRTLHLNDNMIESVEPLTPLANLQDLRLESNKIHDLEPLVKNLGISGRISVEENELSNSSSTTYIPILKSRQIIVTHDLFLPTMVTFVDSRLEVAVRTAIGAKTKPLDLQILSKLEEFDLSEVELVDPNGIEGKIRNLRGLEFCRNIRFLNLNGKLSPPEGKTHFDISPLKGLSRLEYVDLSQNRIQDLRPLKNLANLSTLILEQNHITNLEALADLNQLKNLNLNQNQIHDPLPGKESTLSKITSLELLLLSKNPISDLDVLSNLVNLRELDVSYCQLSDIDPLRNLTNLVMLNFSYNQVRDLHAMSNLNNLEYLDGTANQIDNLKAIETIEKLITISFANNHIRNIYPLVSRLDLLETPSGQIDLRQNPLNNTGITSHIPNLKKSKIQVEFDSPILEPVTLADDNLENAIRKELKIPSRILTTEDLLELKELKLDTSDTEITSIVGLDQAANLQVLEIQGWKNNPFSDLSPLSELENLTQLILWGQQITDLNPLEKLVSLTKLDLGPNGLDETTDLSILSNLVNLTELAIRHNDIVDLSFLQSLSMLDSLNLEQNEIDDISVLENLSILKRLDLSDNQIRNIGVLKELPELEWLELQNNRITDITPLVENPWKGHLRIHGNPIDNTAQLTHVPTLLERGVSVIYDPPTVEAVVFKEAQLENAIRETLQIPINPLTKTDLLNLTELDVNALDIKDLTGLEQCLNLTKLKMSWNFDLVDISNLKRLKKLRYLSLHYNRISSLEPVSDLTKLTYLGLDGNPIFDLSPIQKLKELRRLDFNNSDRLVDLSPLVNLSNLRVLTMDNQQLTDLLPLSRLSELQVLRLGNNWIHDLTPLLETVENGAELELQKNPLNNVAYNVHIPQLQSREIQVKFDPPPEDIIPITDSKIEALIRDTLQVDFNQQPLGALTISLTEPIEKLIAKDLNLQEIDVSALKALPNLISIDLTNNPLNQTALVEQVPNLETYGISVILNGMETEKVSISSLAQNNQIPMISSARTLITLNLTNSDGLPVNHETVTLDASYGQIQSPAINQGDGTYTATYYLGAVNQNQIKQVEISAVTQNKKIGQLKLSVVDQLTILGDINYDQQVNIQDLVWVANHFGQSGKHLVGDINDDQRIDLFDLTLVAQNFAPLAAPITLLEEKVERLILHQNYPNPFNPETWIPFQLSGESAVKFEIHNVSGQLVRRLSLGQLPAGKYLDRKLSAYWDGRSESGELVGSGVYFYTIFTDRQRLTRQMMILK